MNQIEIEEYLSNFQGSQSSLPFGPEALVYKVMGKMFALVSQGEEVTRVTLKCNPEDGAMLVGQHESVVPGYYMNKKHWITISLINELPTEMISELATESYKLIVSKLTKKDKTSLKDL